MGRTSRQTNNVIRFFPSDNRAHVSTRARATSCATEEDERTLARYYLLVCIKETGTLHELVLCTEHATRRMLGYFNASVNRPSESALVTRRLRRLMTRCTAVSLSCRANTIFKSNGAHATASYRVATVFATDRWIHVIHCANSRCLVLSVAFIRRVVRAYCFLVRRYFGPRL